MKVYSNLNGNNSKINASEIAYKDGNTIELLNNIIKGLKGTILWTNTSPTSSFSAQDVSINGDDIDTVTVICKNATTENKIYTGTLYAVGQSVIPQQVWGTNYRAREITWASKNIITFAVGQRWNGTTTSTENTAMIPLFIIGYNT